MPVSKWVELDNKKKKKQLNNGTELKDNGLKQSKTTIPDSPCAYIREGLFVKKSWGAYFREGSFLRWGVGVGGVGVGLLSEFYGMYVGISEGGFGFESKMKDFVVVQCLFSLTDCFSWHPTRTVKELPVCQLFL